MIVSLSVFWMPLHSGKAPDVSRGVDEDMLREQRQAHNRDRGSSRGLLDRDLVASQVSYHSGMYISRGAQYQQALAALLVPLLQSD